MKVWAPLFDHWTERRLGEFLFQWNHRYLSHTSEGCAAAYKVACEQFNVHGNEDYQSEAQNGEGQGVRPARPQELHLRRVS